VLQSFSLHESSSSVPGFTEVRVVNPLLVNDHAMTNY